MELKTWNQSRDFKKQANKQFIVGLEPHVLRTCSTLELCTPNPKEDCLV